uniref:hypothetical protein n=1 Tax=Flavobacterium sp. TaxID=239 RepID=UPI00404A7478
MKNVFYGFLFFNLFMVFQSCSNDNEIDNESLDKGYSNLRTFSHQERIDKLNTLTINILSLRNLEYNLISPDSIIINKNDNYRILVSEIVSNTKDIFEHLGVAESDLFTLEDQQEREISYIALGIGLATKHLESGDITGLPDGFDLQANGQLWDCFKTAVGIDVFSALIESAYAMYAAEVNAGWAVDTAAKAAFRKAGVKAVKQIMTSYFGGFGAAIMIGSFLWCMAN